MISTRRITVDGLEVFVLDARAPERVRKMLGELT